jgi:hypothetical protein
MDTHTVGTASAASTTGTVFTFGTNINVSVVDGGYGMSCALPPGGRVNSYRWAEN